MTSSLMWITGSEIGVFRAKAGLAEFRYRGDKFVTPHTMAMSLLVVITP